MKTARLTLLTTPEFKAFLTDEASRGGVSVAELVRSRCVPQPSADEAVLAALAGELRQAVQEARVALQAGLDEAGRTLAALRASGSPAAAVAGESVAAA